MEAEPTFRYSMRSLGLSVGIVSLSTLLLVPCTASAQRAKPARHQARPTEVGAVPSAATAGQHCTANCGDYSLVVVSAVLPFAGSSAGTPTVTMVIENRGTVSAPLSLVSVAPRNHVTLAHQSIIPALAPGEQATIELPVQTTDDGAECISITISPAPIPNPETTFLAAVVPEFDDSGFGVPVLPDFTPAFPFGRMSLR
jgi:hypothetical protein